MTGTESVAPRHMIIPILSNGIAWSHAKLFYMGPAHNVNLLIGWYVETEWGIEGPFSNEQEAIKATTPAI